ncbi:MAG: Ig-like domain-containing protein, partial [Pseudomarimonas sp.]
MAEATAAPPVSPPVDTNVCNGINGDGGSTLQSTPGVWWNPRRDGTGWQLLRLAQDQSLIVTWYTYDGMGRPTWLLSSAEVVQADGTWRADLHRYTWVYGSGANPGSSGGATRVGSVAIRFDSSDQSRAAVKWQWDEAGSAAQPDECIGNFSHVQSRPAPNAVNAAFTGAWYEEALSGWGLTLNVVLSSSAGQAEYRETSALTVYDDAGNPVWLLGAAQPAGSAPPLNTADAYPLTVYFSGTGYSNGVPTTDCDADAVSCVLLMTNAADWRRSYIDPATGRAAFELHATATELLSAAGRPINGMAITRFDRPLVNAGTDRDGDGDPDPPLAAPDQLGDSVEIEKLSTANQVVVDRTRCEAVGAATSCVVVVNWSAHPEHFPLASLFQRNLTTGAVEILQNGGESGESLVTLPINQTLQFEVRQNSNATSAPLAFSPVVTVTGNQLPTASLTAPTASSSSYTAPATIQLAATASDPDGIVQRVEFVHNNVIIHTDYAAPYEYTWTNVAAGTYSVSARAIDNLDGPSVTAPITIVVTTPPVAVLPTEDYQSDSVGATPAEFRVDESGAATYSIPLYAAPGTAGVVPSLSLNYSSQAGVGSMGRGWSIGGTSAITRCRASLEAGDTVPTTGKGDDPRIGFNAGPLTFTDSDRFCLDGQRLLEVAPAAASACPTISGQFVRQLRTEIESHRRICGYSPSAAGTGSGPKFFTVESKDGSTSWFGDRRAVSGAASNAFLAGNATDQTQTDTYYHWALGRFEDSTGNYIDYEYLKDPGGAARPGELLLQRASYTGKRVLVGQTEPASLPYAHVEFQYEVPFGIEDRKGYFAGTSVWSTRRLKQIFSRADGQELRDYQLIYGQATSGANETQLQALQECRNAPRPGGGTNRVCLNRTEFQWSSAVHGFRAPSPQFDLPTGSQSKFGGMKFGDVDGDGRLDMVWVKDGQENEVCRTEQIHVFYARAGAGGALEFKKEGSEAFLCAPREFDRDEGGSLDRNWFLLDYNGDGKDDIFLRGSAQWVGRQSQGTASGTQNPFNQTADLLASIPIPAGSTLDHPVQRADLNADGLPDLIYYHEDQERIFARLMTRASGSGSPYVWGEPMSVQLEGINELAGSPPPGELMGLYAKGGFDQLNDFNGDGRSDVVVVVDVTRECGVGGGGGGHGGPPHTPRPHHRPGGQSVPNTPTTVCTIPFLYAMVVSKVPQPGAGGSIILSQYPGGAIGNGYFEGLRFVDLNGDGLSDIYNPNVLGNLANMTFRVNSGKGFLPSRMIQNPGSIAITGQPQIHDVSGDGRPDIVFPSHAVSTTVTDGGYGFAFKLGVPQASVAADNGVGFANADTGLPGWRNLATRCPTPACLNENRGFYFGDYNGDGALDFLRVNWRDGASRAQLTLSIDERRPRDVIERFTNGLGAKTEVRYGSLNNRAHYRRDRDSRNELSVGRGSPVEDVHAPWWVVTEAKSSAPTQVNVNAMSRVLYRYVGAKMQAGGRGFLGFRQIHTIDANHDTSHVVTQTEYMQDFPFIGRPHTTSTKVVESAFEEDACAISFADSCFVSGAETPFAYGGRLIALAESNWIPPSVSLAFPGAPQRVELQSTRETTYGLSPAPLNTVLSRVETSYSYRDSAGTLDPWGNVRSTEVKTFDGSGAWLATVSTANEYTVEDPARWRLGRLTKSTVTHQRTGEAARVRSSEFTYQMSGAATGLLLSESVQNHVQGTERKYQHLRTFHVLDDWGNRVRSHTCSTELSEAQCKATADGAGSNFVFQTDDTDGSRIQRYGRTQFDGRGRFVAKSFAPFWNGTAEIELTTSEVIAPRNDFGDVTQASDINGVQSRAVFGSMGRAYYTWTATVPNGVPGAVGQGVATTTTYRFCAQLGGACPNGAVYREQITTTGQGTRWVYADVLGRPVMAATHTLNAAGSGESIAASCTFHDALGRVNLTSEPFFLGELGDQTPAVSSASCTVGQRFYSRTEYDVLGRPLLTTQPDATHASGMSTSTFAYSGLTTTLTNPLGQIRTEIRNALGELVEVRDHYGLAISNTYDAVGSLRKVSRNGGRGMIESVMLYDDMGRKIQSNDPDAGSWKTVYNAAGEVIEQIPLHAGQSQRTVQRYDARGRVFVKRVNNAQGQLESTTSMVYDTALNGRGQMTTETSTGNYSPGAGDGGQPIGYSRRVDYDALGRAHGGTTTIDGIGYSTAVQFDGLSRPWKSLDA